MGIHFTFIIFFFLNALPAQAAQAFSQIIIPDSTDGALEYSYDELEHALLLQLPNTSTKDLDALERYNPELVQRVVIKELGGNTAHVKFFLKNDKIRYLIRQLQEPARISIDFFPEGYRSHSHHLGNPTPGTDEQNPPVLDDEIALEGEVAQDPAPTAGLSSPSDVTESMAGSRRWQQFPVYIYRANLRMDPASSLKLSELTVSPKVRVKAFELASQAVHAYDSGKELAAKSLFERSLQLDSEVLTMHPVFIWKFAESNLAGGTYLLAKGYYQVLESRYPGSIYAQFAKLRLLDLIAIESFENHNPSRHAELFSALGRLEMQADAPELKAWQLIRRAFWSVEAVQEPVLPAMNAQIFTEGRELLNKNRLNNQETAFVLNALLVHHISAKEVPWQAAYGVMAGDFFSAYKDKSSAFYHQLKDQLRDRLIRLFTEHFAKGENLAIIEAYESLPKSLQSIRKAPGIAFLIGQAYRALGKISAAIDLYTEALANDPDKSTAFQAHFLTAYLLNRSIANQTLTSTSAYRTTEARSDKAALGLYEAMQIEQKQAALRLFQQEALESVRSKAKLITPAIMLLDALKTNGVASLNQGEDQSSVISLIKNMGTVFARSKRWPERTQSIELLKNLTPAQFSDAKARQIWTSELYQLAEQYRKSNQYLKAGELMKFTAENSAEWDGRGEALYKSGLLLLKAGRRAEAIDALDKACADENNLYYKNLSCERLAQLEK